jgi:hypothetical protein
MDDRRHQLSTRVHKWCLTTGKITKETRLGEKPQANCEWSLVAVLLSAYQRQVLACQGGR